MNAMARLGVVIQARMGSMRFPGKVMADFCGSPMLLFQIKRLKQMDLGGEIIVATTHLSQDIAISKLCENHEIGWFRGDEENLFKRFRDAAEHFGFDHVIRLTADNPLPFAEIIKTALNVHLESEADLTSTRVILPDRSIRRFVVKGCSVDVLNAKALNEIDPNRLDAFQREHVIPVFFEENFNVELVKQVDGFRMPEVELSVDTEPDLKRVAQYYRNVMQRGG